MSTLKKIGARLKYFLSPTAAALAEAGFIDTCDGKITEAGRSALWLILMKEHEAAFLEAAKAHIEELKEEAAKA